MAWLSLLVPALLVLVGNTISQTTVPKDYGNKVCPGATTLIPHPQVCQRYFDCSDTTSRPERSFFGPFELECPYPQLFDKAELRCKSFKSAKCGANRKAGKDACDYFANLCGSAHCQECSSRMPSCVGLKDGKNVHPNREWTPYYIVCDSDRLTESKTCDRHKPTNTTGFFSPLTKSCVSAWEVPQSTGYGLAPSCAGKEKGSYLSNERSDVYYRCPQEKVLYCPAGKNFNTAQEKCL